MPGQREDFLTWDEYFMAIALLSAQRSKDPRTQVGACIVDKSHHILSTGYNSASKGISDTYDMPWHSNGEVTGDKMQIKDYFVVHAEANALDNFSGIRESLNSSTLYVTLFPCHECAKKIARSGIKRVVYLDMYKKNDIVDISKYILEKAGIQYEQYNSKSKEKLEEMQREFVKKIRS